MEEEPMSSYGHHHRHDRFNSSLSPIHTPINSSNSMDSNTRVSIPSSNGNGSNGHGNGTNGKIISPNGHKSPNGTNGHFSVALVSRSPTMVKSNYDEPHRRQELNQIYDNGHRNTLKNMERNNLKTLPSRLNYNDSSDDDDNGKELIVIKSQAMKDEIYSDKKTPRSKDKKMVKTKDVINGSDNQSNCGIFSKQFIIYVLFVFNFILFSSGIIIMVIIIFYSTPASYSIRNILPYNHPLNIVFYSLICSSIFMCIVSIFNLCCTCCKRTKRPKKNILKESQPLYSNPKYDDIAMKKKKNISENGKNDSSTKVLLRKDKDLKKKSDAKGKKNKDDVNLNQTRASNIDDMDTFDIEVGFTSDFVHPSNSNHDQLDLMIASPSSDMYQPSQRHVFNGGLSSPLSDDNNIYGHRSVNGHRQFNGHNGHYSGQKPKLPIPIKREDNNTCLICCFIFILLFIFTIQLTISFLGFISSTQLEQLVISDSNQSNLIESIKDKYSFDIQYDADVENVTTDIAIADILVYKRSSFDTIESLYKCCGLIEFTDYVTNSVPDSCCKTRTLNCGARRHPSNIYYSGCAEKVTISIREELILLSSIALGFSFVQIFGLLFACCFYVQSINSYSKHRYVI